ncbi:MAG TPA: ATPase [Clostridiales bacterium]|jgi:sugar (pentulose or hexulose) kinase|nr:ATPase [Clostridiales bacterium]
MTQEINNAAKITGGDTYLGIEFGSSRIKAVLIDKDHAVLASGAHNWENRLENGFWTYSMEDVFAGLQDAFAKLAANVEKQYGVKLARVGAMGVSAMMHGYLAFDEKNNLLAPFRTWRNTTTGQAAETLSARFGFNIPQRWSIAHLYQAMLNGEAHVGAVAFLTTLAGYIHYRLTGEKVIGIGDGSGMFPIDSVQMCYDQTMLDSFQQLVKEHGYGWNIAEVLPRLLSAGIGAGSLSPEGAALLDPSGTLQSGIPFCPPEGDAGTGMVATNAVRQRTGNVSAGTSVFAMLVLEKALSRYYPEVDMVTTPAGDPVAMVHCNNCTSDIDAWIRLFDEAATALGAAYDERTLYQTLYKKALEGAPDCGGIMAFNYLSGEHVTNLEEGRPLLFRKPDAAFSLANVMRAHLTSACASLRIGMDILSAEHVKLDAMTGHGGFFKAEGIGQKIMSAALGTPVTVMATAGEGGPWGIAVLAAYMQNKAADEPLSDYLTARVFHDAKSVTISATEAEAAGFAAFMEGYKRSLAVERAAVEAY